MLRGCRGLIETRERQPCHPHRGETAVACDVATEAGCLHKASRIFIKYYPYLSIRVIVSWPAAHQSSLKKALCNQYKGGLGGNIAQTVYNPTRRNVSKRDGLGGKAFVWRVKKIDFFPPFPLFFSELISETVAEKNGEKLCGEFL